MCLAVPVKVISVDGDKAVIDSDGIRREANISLIEKVEPGDYIIVHAGFAIQKVDETAAQEALKVITAIIEDVSKEMGHTEPGGLQSYG